MLPLGLLQLQPLHAASRGGVDRGQHAVETGRLDDLEQAVGNLVPEVEGVRRAEDGVLLVAHDGLGGAQLVGFGEDAAWAVCVLPVLLLGQGPWVRVPFEGRVELGQRRQRHGVEEGRRCGNRAG